MLNESLPSRRLQRRGHPLGRVLLASLCFAVVAGCGPKTQPPRVIHYDSRPWDYRGMAGTELRSIHYTLRTTCEDEEFLNLIPVFLEACWQQYEALLPSDYELNEPAVTYLFHQRWEWDRFTEDFAPDRAATYKRIRSGGYSERGVTVSHYSSRRGTLSVLAHEGLHQYLELTRGGQIPPWLNEGLACYFEGFDLDPTDRNRPVFTPEYNPLRSSHLRDTLAHKRMIPLSEILATHAGLEVQKRPRHVRSYYAQEWSLVLYLLQPSYRNPYHAGFRALLDEVGTEVMRRKANALMAAVTDETISVGEAVFRAYISDDLEQFETDYEAFMRDLLDMNW